MESSEGTVVWSSPALRLWGSLSGEACLVVFRSPTFYHGCPRCKHSVCPLQKPGAYRSVEERRAPVAVTQRPQLASAHVFFIFSLCTGFWFVSMVVVVLSVIVSPIKIKLKIRQLSASSFVHSKRLGCLKNLSAQCPLRPHKSPPFLNYCVFQQLTSRGSLSTTQSHICNCTNKIKR